MYCSVLIEEIELFRVVALAIKLGVKRMLNEQKNK